MGNVRPTEGAATAKRKEVVEGLKEAAVRYIDAHARLFTDVSDRIWENPELSLQEYKSAALYCRVLREGGFEVTEHLGGIETAFMGKYGSGRPVIGFLGEFDALAGMCQERACPEKKAAGQSGRKAEADMTGQSSHMAEADMSAPTDRSAAAPDESAPGHGCGHNMLGAGDLAAAFAVKDYLQRTGRPGTVIFYGCPGEEGGASKAFFARDGLWRDLDAALTWHPSDVNEVVSGTNNSSIQVLYSFRGTAAHAANDPFNGRSALDAVELMNTGVQYLREHMTPDCRVHYAITDTGGVSPNVVQARAAVLYLVRANKVKDSLKLLERVDKIAEGAALMTETSYERTFIDGTAELVPNFVLERALYENFSALPLPSYTEEELELANKLKETCPLEEAPGIGARFDPAVEKLVREQTGNGTRALNDFLIPPVHTTGFVPGSSDVGDVGWQTPTAQIHTAAFISGAPGHSWQNVSSGGSSIGHKALLLAGKVLAMTAIDLYEDEELLVRAREEFAQRTAGGYDCPIEAGAVPTCI